MAFSATLEGLIGSKTEGSVGSFINSSAIDGGNFIGSQGYGLNLPQWQSNQAYRPTNIFCVLLEAPRVFELFPNSTEWLKLFKQMFETRSIKIEGLNSTLTVEYQQHNLAGGLVQSEFSDVKIAPSEPAHTFIDMYGAPIQKLHEIWIRYGMMDPITRGPLFATLNNASVPAEQTVDWFTASAIYIQMDPALKKVFRAWLCVNMMPDGTGDIIGKKDKSAAIEVANELTIKYTSIHTSDMGAVLLAQSIVDNISFANANPILTKAPLAGISTDISAILKGFKESVTDMAVTS